MGVSKTEYFSIFTILMLGGNGTPTLLLSPLRFPLSGVETQMFFQHLLCLENRNIMSLQQNLTKHSSDLAGENLG